MNSTKIAAILYHYPCPDGAFSALAAHLYFSATSTPAVFFPNTVYSPLRAVDLPLHEIDDVYLLDFVGPTGFVEEISSKVSRVIILDHHKTALETLGGTGCDIGTNVLKVLDMNRSGATIAYDYFKEKLEGKRSPTDPNTSLSRCTEVVLAEYRRVRQLFEYIEDGDLWRWKLKDSKAFSSGLKDLSIEFNANLNPSLFKELLSLNLESIIKNGMESLSKKQKLIDGILDQSFEISIGGGSFGKCLAVIADSIPELRSELGHQLATKSQNFNLRGIGAVVYKVPELDNDDIVKISLRSIESEDTTLISQAKSRRPLSGESLQKVQESDEIEKSSSWAARLRKGRSIADIRMIGKLHMEKVGNSQSKGGSEGVADSKSSGESLSKSSGEILIKSKDLKKPASSDEEAVARLSEKQISTLKMVRRKGAKVKKDIKYQRRKKLREARLAQIREPEVEITSQKEAENKECERRRLQRVDAEENYKESLELGVKGSLPAEGRNDKTF
ncbi:unnamed protein product [Rhodiola kirilowii]